MIAKYLQRFYTSKKKKCEAQYYASINIAYDTLIKLTNAAAKSIRFWVTNYFGYYVRVDRSTLH